VLKFAFEASVQEPAGEPNVLYFALLIRCRVQSVVIERVDNWGDQKQAPAKHFSRGANSRVALTMTPIN